MEDTLADGHLGLVGEDGVLADNSVVLLVLEAAQVVKGGGGWQQQDKQCRHVNVGSCQQYHHLNRCVITIYISIITIIIVIIIMVIF